MSRKDGQAADLLLAQLQAEKKERAKDWRRYEAYVKNLEDRIETLAKMDAKRLERIAFLEDRLRAAITTKENMVEVTYCKECAWHGLPVCRMGLTGDRDYCSRSKDKEVKA